MPGNPTNSSEGQKRTGWIGSLLALPNDSTVKTLVVALLLCLVCSVLISTAAVSLKPLQITNRDLDRKKIILEVTKLMRAGTSLDELFKQVEPKVVDLETGEYVDSINPNQYDQRKAAKDPLESVAIPRDRDVAHIKRRAKYATVYLYKENDKVKYFVLPIHGYGLWSTLYGFLVLEGDANTVFGLQYYEHAETPGLGGEVDNPKWREKWHGKLVYDSQGAPQIKLVKGAVTPDDPKAQFHVDGLAGATLTANGVTNMMRYWLGQDGFGPYLQKFQSAT
ncbi:MAG: Na(+)-translocating NADH-quinone reductase subunit C [Nitrospirae bacterium]|nr:Na(+)-translocating NADH-quinone reductase subunit C [Nitrospirota bacterium]